MSKITPETVQFNASYADRHIAPFWGIVHTPPPSISTFSMEDVINFADNIIFMIHGSALNTSTLATLTKLFDNSIRSYIITSAYKADYLPYLARVQVHFSQLYGFGNFIMLISDKGKNRLFIQKNNDGYIEFNWNNYLHHYFVYAFWHFDNTFYQLTKNTTSKIPDAPEFVPTVPVNKDFLIINREYVFGKQLLIDYSKKAKKRQVICCNDIELINELITNSSPKIEKIIYISKDFYQKKLLENLEIEKVTLRIVDDKIKPFLLSDDTIISIEHNDTTILGIIDSIENGLIDYHLSNSFIEYQVETILEKVKYQKILFNIDNPKSTNEIKEMHQIQDTFVLKLEQMKNKDYPVKHYIEKGYADYGFVRNVDFSIKFEPESIKHSAPKDTLYNQWLNFKSNLLEYTKKLDQVNEDAILESSKLSVTERFLNRLLGKKTNYTRISKELEKIKERITSEQVKYVEFYDIIDKLNKTNQDLRSDKEDFENLVEENNQYKKFKEDKDSLISKIQNRTKEYETISLEFSKKKNELESVIAQLDKNESSRTYLADKLEKLNKEQEIHNKNFTDKNNYDLKIKRFVKEVENLNDEAKLIDINRTKLIGQIALRRKQLNDDLILDDSVKQDLIDKNEDDEYTILKNDERKADIDTELTQLDLDIKEHRKLVDQLNSSTNLIMEIKLEVSDIKTQLKTMNDNMRELSSEQSVLNRLVNELSKKQDALSNEVLKMQNQLETQYKEFVYKPSVKSLKTDDAFASVIPSNKKKDKSNPVAKQSIFPAMMEREMIPVELPKVGLLYFYQNKKWLGITDWDEYKSGITEAERLNATLVWAKE